MKRIYQIFGGALGWTLGGPIGAIMGAALGTYLHKATSTETDPNRILNEDGNATTAGDFHVSLLVLSAVVIKADGKVTQDELDFVRKRFVQMFGKAKANQSFSVFKEVVNQDIDTAAVCAEIRKNTTHAMRLQLVHFLFQIAQADGHIDEAELNSINKIATLMYVRKPDFESIKAMFVRTKYTYGHSSSSNSARTTYTYNYYQILEIEKTATEQEIKAAYRKMVKKYHPDKLVGLGEDVKKAAQDKFIKVQEAYDEICKQRGMN